VSLSKTSSETLGEPKPTRYSDLVGLHHAHLEETEDIGVNSEGITLGRVVRQITVAVYVDENLDQFDERSRRLIETGV